MRTALNVQGLELERNGALKGTAVIEAQFSPNERFWESPNERFWEKAKTYQREPDGRHHTDYTDQDTSIGWAPIISDWRSWPCWDF
jgi:hypothetical protein